MDVTGFLINPVVWYGASALAYAALGVGLLLRGGGLLRQNMLAVAVGGIGWSTFFAFQGGGRSAFHLGSAAFIADAFFMKIWIARLYRL